MNGSGRFAGVAKMMSKNDENFEFKYWAMDDVWKGKFEVEWLIIKDIPNKKLKEKDIKNNENLSITNSRDTQEISIENGIKFIKVFEEVDITNTTSILQHFEYYDQREEIFKSAEKKVDLENIEISKKFNNNKKVTNKNNNEKYIDEKELDKDLADYFIN